MKIRAFAFVGPLFFAGIYLLAPSAGVAAAARPPATGNDAPVLMSKGDRVPWSNLAELESFAAQDNFQACAQLGQQLLRGEGIVQNVPRALDLLEIAARGGVGSAAFRLGMVLDDGLGVKQDRIRALDYFRAAAAGGVAEAFFNVGAAYVGAHGVKRDYAEGLAWLILATKRGAGQDTEVSVRDRIEKMRRPEWIAAAEKRAPLIEAELKAKKAADFLPAPAAFVVMGAPPPTAPATNTETVDASPAPSDGPLLKVLSPTGRTLSWPDFAALERAAERDSPGAAAALGQVLLAGKLVPADPLRALNVLERAAKAGSADAAHLLADLYTKGQHVARDDAKAFAFNLQAARGGSIQAMYNTGALFTNGRGTPRDYTAALAWLIVAKNYQLDPGAEKRIRTLLEKSAPAQIPVAEKRALELQREIEAVLANPDRP